MARTASRGASDTTVRVRERGHVYFAYRPKLESEAPTGLDDVQRFYMILSPHGRDSYRLIIIGPKRLPATAGEDRTAWGFVDKVSSHSEEIEDELDPKNYFTKESRVQHLPAARPVGEGVYMIVRHRGHTHLAHLLELPSEPGEVQRAFNITREASYIVSVKNPKAAAPPGLGLDESRETQFPKSLLKHFRGRRFIPLDPPDFLDHEGAEIMLLGASTDVTGELGLKLNPEHEAEENAQIFTDLGLEKSLHPLAPLLEGKWA
jgi:hypothetical protein